MANTIDTSVIDSLNALNSNKKESTAISEQQSRFLKLLTTQLKNQDPLNPMDNAQMTSQMAQISTVDGIERLNATLKTLMSNSNTEQAMQAAALVGHGALVKGSGLELGTNGAIGGYDLASAADTVKIEIKDANGTVIRHITVADQDAGVQNFVWDGKDDNGVAAATGKYSFTVTAQGSNKGDITVDALEFGYISGVARTSTGDVKVDVGNLGRFAFDDLKQII